MILLSSSLDTIHHVNDFYQSAWDKLIDTITIVSIVLGALITFIGIIMPLWLQHLQKQNFKEERERFMAELKTSRIKLRKSINKLRIETEAKLTKLENNSAETIKSIKEQQEHAENMSEAILFFLQGRISIHDDYYAEAFINFITSASHSLEIKEYKRCSTAINNATLSLDKIAKKEELEKEFINNTNSLKEYIDKFDDEIKKFDDKVEIEKELKDKIKELKEAIDKLE